MNNHSASGKAVLFDVDGTLLDTVPLILEAYQYIFRKFLGHPLGDDEVLAGIGEPLDIYLKKQFPDDLANAMLEAYLVYYRSQMETSIGIFLHVPKMIEMLTERGIPLAIVTSKRQGSAVHNLGMFGLTDHFQAVISKESTKKHKPDPEPAVEAMRQLNLTDPSKVILVGDSLYDLHCAKRAGCRSAIVSWTAMPADELQAGTPDLWLETPDQLMDLLDRI